MKVKITWMLFLIGFSFVFFSSCEDIIEREYTAEFIYQNQSNDDIEMILMGEILEGYLISESSEKKYLIEPNQSISFEIKPSTNSKITEMPTGILKQNNLLGDSVQINYDSGKTLRFHQNEVGRDSIYLESNYKYSQTGDYSVKYVFTFE